MNNEEKKKLDAEEKEKAEIKWENDILAYLMPGVGLLAFIIGLVGFILVISSNVGVGIFLLILAILGAGGIVYGVLAFLKKRFNKFHKPEHEPSPEPNK